MSYRGKRGCWRFAVITRSFLDQNATKQKAGRQSPVSIYDLVRSMHDTSSFFGLFTRAATTTTPHLSSHTVRRGRAGRTSCYGILEMSSRVARALPQLALETFVGYGRLRGRGAFYTFKLTMLRDDRRTTSYSSVYVYLYQMIPSCVQPSYVIRMTLLLAFLGVSCVVNSLGRSFCSSESGTAFVPFSSTYVYV